MPIKRLEITGVRNIVSARLELNPRINIFYGENGSGKTSILESAYVVGLGRSFRSSKIKPIINNQQSECTVFANISVTEGADVPIGVCRKIDGSHVIKVNGKLASTASVLAKKLPLQIVNSDTFQLLEGSPKQRRQFIDWGVFHVEHSFLDKWKVYQKCLKNRNMLLRSANLDFRQLEIWTSTLVEMAYNIDDYRASYVAKLNPVFTNVLNRISSQLGQVSITYYRGWDESRDLQELLTKSLKSDRQQGFTRVGPHRADLIIRFDKQSASDILSRGQQKLVVYALRVAQGMLMTELCQKICCYLLDDLPAELDAGHQRILCDLFEGIGSQVLVTCVDRKSLAKSWTDHGAVSMFHVKHGRVSPEIVVTSA